MFFIYSLSTHSSCLSVFQVLTADQAATTLSRPPIFGGFEFNINNVQFSLDTTGATCPQMTHLCVEFAKGDAPDPRYKQLPFDVLGVEAVDDDTPNPSRLISCAPFLVRPKCEGMYMLCGEVFFLL